MGFCPLRKINTQKHCVQHSTDIMLIYMTLTLWKLNMFFFHSEFQKKAATVQNDLIEHVKSVKIRQEEKMGPTAERWMSSICSFDELRNNKWHLNVKSFNGKIIFGWFGLPFTALCHKLNSIKIWSHISKLFQLTNYIKLLFGLNGLKCVATIR